MNDTTPHNPNEALEAAEGLIAITKDDKAYLCPITIRKIVRDLLNIIETRANQRASEEVEVRQMWDEHTADDVIKRIAALKQSPTEKMGEVDVEGIVNEIVDTICEKKHTETGMRLVAQGFVQATIDHLLSQGIISGGK